MSQLKNTTTIFQNNDLVTAAKLNSLVNDTSLDVEVITGQPNPTAALENTDMLLGHELATNSLVKIPISVLSTLGSPVHSNLYQSFEDSDMEISQTNQNRSLILESLATGGSIVLNNGLGHITFNSGFSSRQYGKFDFNSAPVNVQESVDILGAGIVGNMASVVGSPIITITVTGTHGITSGAIIELDGPTAEFDGIFPINNVGSSSFTMTLPANATVAHTNTPVLIRRPALRTQQLAYLARLQVVGAAKFTAGTEFSSIPVVKGTPLLSLYAIQELEMTTPWTATNAGFYNSVFTSALLTKPANEMWVATGSFHIQTTGYPTYVGIRFSNVTAQTGQYLALDTFEDTANGSTVFDFNWQFSFNVPSATTFTDLSLRLDVNATSGSSARIGHTTSFQNHFSGSAGPIWPLSKITIHKYKTA
jgi:hypothetical protein